MRRIFAPIPPLLCVSSICFAASPGGLDIYFIDVNGGAATLIVTPAREAILVDSGSPVQRDADRILKVVRDVAGLDRIHHLITTHWHLDHYGAVELLAEQIEFGKFYDRGIPDESLDDPKNFPTLIAAYREASKGDTVTVRAGDRIEVKQPADGPKLKIRCVMASGKPVDMQDGKPNAMCDQHKPQADDKGDNGMSLVLLFSFGDFQFVIPGDLTWNLERDLVCPTNPIGQVELMQVSHHGLSSSSNPVMVHALAPRVAVMCNGPTKGGASEVIEAYLNSPGFDALWQLHLNRKDDQFHERLKTRTANTKIGSGGEFIKVQVEPGAEQFKVQIGEQGASAVTYDCW